MRCPYCGDENTSETKWRDATYLCRACGRQFRDFQGNQGALLNVNRLPSIVSRGTGKKKLTSVYVPDALLSKLNTSLIGKAKGRSVARSPFIVAGIIVLMGIVWEEQFEAATQVLLKLSKSPSATAARLRQLADSLELGNASKENAA